MSLLDDMAVHIAAAASLTVGTNLFKSLLPDSPDECTAIYEFAGSQPIFSMSQDLPAIEQPRIQVVCRSVSYATARSRMETIWQSLCGIRDETVNGVAYLCVMPLGSPEQGGRDSAQRERVTTTFQVWK